MLKASDGAAAVCVKRTCRLSVHSQWLDPARRSARSPSALSVFIGRKVPRRLRSVTAWLAESRTRRVVQIRAAILGVGAPEAIVVVVVAMLVFGPRGLASAAKNFGSALRSLQPTIRELAEVSTDLKSTLEQEMGLDELRDDIRAIRSPLTAQPRSPASQAAIQPERKQDSVAVKAASYGSEEQEDVTGAVDAVAEVVDAYMDRKRVESGRVTLGGEVPSAVPEHLDISAMSVAELETELAKRKGQMADGQDSSFA